MAAVIILFSYKKTLKTKAVAKKSLRKISVTVFAPKS